MRVTAFYRPRGVAGAPPRRKGVVLMVVLALLTLFAIGTVSFAFYADSSKRGVTPFRGELVDIADDTVGVASALAPDLSRVTFEPVDLRPHLAALDVLRDREESLRARATQARDRATDPRARRNLADLIANLEEYEELIDQLRCLLDAIHRNQ